MAHVRRGEDGRLVICADSDQDIDVFCRVVLAYLQGRWEPYLTQNGGPDGEAERRQALARP
jgi:hypothetical protein